MMNAAITEPGSPLPLDAVTDRLMEAFRRDQALIDTLLPELTGKYIFGDIVNGRIFMVDVDDLVGGDFAEIDELTLLVNGQPTTLIQILGNDFRADLRFGVDEAGEIYVLSKRDGMVRMLVPEPESALMLAGGLLGLAGLGFRRGRLRPRASSPSRQA